MVKEVKIGLAQGECDKKNQIDCNQFCESIIAISQTYSTIHVERFVVHAKSIQRLAVRFVPIQYNKKSGEGASQMGEVGNIIAAYRSDASK